MRTRKTDVELIDVIMLEKGWLPKYVNAWKRVRGTKEARPKAHNISVMKLPDFETVNDARLLSKDPMLENVTKRQLRAVYDIISRQLSQRLPNPSQ